MRSTRKKSAHKKSRRHHATSQRKYFPPTPIRPPDPNPEATGFVALFACTYAAWVMLVWMWAIEAVSMLSPSLQPYGLPLSVIFALVAAFPAAALTLCVLAAVGLTGVGLLAFLLGVGDFIEQLFCKS